MIRKVNLTKCIQTPAGPRYCAAVVSANGRIKPDYVLIDKQEQKHPEGAYYLDWREAGKRVRLSVGKNAADAFTQFQRKTYELNAAQHGVVIAPPAGTGKPLAVAIQEFLLEIKAGKKHKTWAAYQNSLNYFTQSCHRATIEEVTRKDMLTFCVFLKANGQAPRSIHNKFSNVMSFLKAQGVRDLVGKNDWPRYVEKEVDVYTDEELKTFFAACDPQEHLWFYFLLKTGMREQEFMHSAWSDVNFEKASVTVRYKPEYGFNPKTYKERQISVPTALIVSLQAWRSKTDKKCDLLFPTSGCRPKMDFLDCCKAIAKRAKLNEKRFRLHKFRATRATQLLQNGVDLKTVQRFLGHSDMQSTMRYLAGLQNDALQKQVEAIG